MQPIPNPGEHVTILRGSPRFVGSRVTVEKVCMSWGGVYLDVVWFSGAQLAKFRVALQDVEAADDQSGSADVEGWM